MYPNKYFLHFSYDFWFIVLPLTLVFMYYKYCLYINKKKKNEELARRLPNEKILLNLSKEESLMLEYLTRINKNKSNDEYLRESIKNILGERIC
ncbi:MAG: hypothetical protein IJH34_04545 [Romboutsia sp.]|nr:hypothetical protein [Romboutsia sp.]